MIEQDEHKTAVIFRKWREPNDGGIIALFPEIPAGTQGFYVMSFELVGHHGAADYNSVIFRTVSATKAEYGDLERQLEALGYNLIVCTRQSARMRAKCNGRAE